MVSQKTVIVIGCGFFGLSTANRLASSTNYKIIVITISKHAYFLISSIRVPVQNKTEGTFVPIVDVLDSKVEIIQDEVLNFDETHVELKNHDDLRFDALVIATGAKWPDPIGSNLKFRDDYEAYFAERYEEIAKAKHIVLIGGGFNNCELIGEMIFQYKNELAKGEKKLTMLHSRDLLLPDDGFYSEPLREKVTNFVKSAEGVDLRLNSRGVPLEIDQNKIVVNGDPKDTIEGDLIIYGTGAVPAIPPNNITQLSDTKGFIRINESFQAKAFPTGNIFAIGDVTDFEYRGLMIRRPWLKTLVNNVKLVVQDPNASESRFYRVDRPKGHVTSYVSMGPEHGFGQLCFPWIGTVQAPNWFVTKTKSNTLSVSFAKRLFNS